MIQYIFECLMCTQVAEGGRGGEGADLVGYQNCNFNKAITVQEPAKLAFLFTSVGFV